MTNSFSLSMNKALRKIKILSQRGGGNRERVPDAGAVLDFLDLKLQDFSVLGN